MVMLLGAVVNNGIVLTVGDTVNKNVWVCPKASVIAMVVLPAFSKLRVKVPPLDDTVAVLAMAILVLLTSTSYLGAPPLTLKTKTSPTLADGAGGNNCSAVGTVWVTVTCTDLVVPIESLITTVAAPPLTP